MATCTTTVSYNQIAGETDLDVKSIFNELMQASTERGSMYLRAKETIIDYVEKGQLDEREKASLVANIQNSSPLDDGTLML